MTNLAARIQKVLWIKWCSYLYSTFPFYFILSLYKN